MITRKELKEAKEIIEKANQAPWFVHKPKDRDAYIAYGEEGNGHETYDLYDAYNVETDYKYIAYFQPSFTKRLIETIEDLRDIIKELEINNDEN